MLPVQLQRLSVSINRIGQSMLRQRITLPGPRFWAHRVPNSKLIFPAPVEGLIRVPLTGHFFFFYIS